MTGPAFPSTPGEHRATFVPGLGLDRFAFVSANALLECLCDQLALTYGGPVQRCCLYPGEEIVPMDYCCSGPEGNGMAAVRIYRIFPTTDRFPQQDFNPRECNHLSYGVTFEMTVYRCACVLQDNGDPPDCDCLTDNVAVQMDDAAAMRRALRCCFSPRLDGELLFSGTPAYIEDDYNPVGPAGDCFGGRQRATIQVYDCDCDTPPMQVVRP